MSDCFIIQYDLTPTQKLIFPLFSVYSYRHLIASRDSTTWTGRTVHLLISLAEAPPLVGAIVSMFELYIASNFREEPKAETAPSKLKERVMAIPEQSTLSITHPSLPTNLIVAQQNKSITKPVVSNRSESVDQSTIETMKIMNPTFPAILDSSYINMKLVTYPKNQAVIVKKTKLEKFPKVDIDTILAGVKNEADATRYILTTNGFESEVGDIFKAPHGYTGDVQGNLALRTVTSHVTKKYPNAISPSSLKAQRELNLEQYLILKIKRFGHAQSLKGIVTLPSGKNFHLEGFCEAFTIPMVVSSFQEFIKSNMSNADDFLWINDHLMNTTSSDYASADDIQMMALCIQDPMYIGPTVISSGYNWHDTSLIFFGNYLFYCNRGAGSEGHAETAAHPGITIFSLPDRSKVTEAVIWEMTKRQEMNYEESWGVDLIRKNLGGIQVHYEKMPPQVVGNCTYLSKKTTLYSLMCIKQCLNFSDHSEISSGQIDSNLWSQIFNVVRPKYKEWAKFDREFIYEEFLTEVQEWLDSKSSFGQAKLSKTFLEPLRVCLAMKRQTDQTQIKRIIGLLDNLHNINDR